MQADAAVPADSQQCPICLHHYDRRSLTKHHLVPRSRRGREVILLCRACHNQIHLTFDEKTLERRFNTIEALVEADEFRSWVSWIRKRKPTRRIAGRPAKQRAPRRRRR